MNRRRRSDRPAELLDPERQLAAPTVEATPSDRYFEELHEAARALRLARRRAAPMAVLGSVTFGAAVGAWATDPSHWGWFALLNAACAAFAAGRRHLVRARRQGAR